MAYIWIMLCYMLQAQSFLVDDDYPTSLSVWINDLGLSEHDRRVLCGGEWLNADHISAAQMLLKRSFPFQNGLCDTSHLAERCHWPAVPQSFVQIIHVGDSHWVCVSNKFDEEHVVELFDSLHT